MSKQTSEQIRLLLQRASEHYDIDAAEEALCTARFHDDPSLLAECRVILRQIYQHHHTTLSPEYINAGEVSGIFRWVAHDLTSVFSGLSLYLDLSTKHKMHVDRQERYLKHMKAMVDDGLDLIGIMHLAGTTYSGRYASIKPHDIIPIVKRSIKQATYPYIVFSTSVSEPLLCQIDERSLLIALKIFFSEVIRYVPRNTTYTVSVNADDKSAEIKIMSEGSQGMGQLIQELFKKHGDKFTLTESFSFSYLTLVFRAIHAMKGSIMIEKDEIKSVQTVQIIVPRVVY